MSAKKAQVLFGFGLGIYAFFNRKINKGFAIFTLSSIWWFIASSISSKGGDYLSQRLGYLGNSTGDIIFNLITKPSKENIKTYVPIGLFLVSLSFLDVFVNAFFNFNLMAFLPAKLSYFLPLIGVEQYQGSEENPADLENLNDKSKIWDMLLILNYHEIIWGLTAVRRSINVSRDSSILFE